MPALDASEVSVRLQRARRAQREWQKTSFAERRRVLRRLLDVILDRADELCRLLSAEAGKTLQNAMMGEIFPVCEKLRYTLNHGEDDLRAEKISSGLLLHKTATIEFHPLGVIGVICPWNFPLQNILGPTIPALFSGNAVLCKVSEWSSHSAPRIQALLDEVLTSCGHSPDLVQILTGFGDTGAALVRSGVDKIVFTGSVPNGRRVLEGSVQNLTPVVLELGGKDPLIVCDDADLSQAVAGALAGVFICSGQMCLAAERIYVMDGIYDRFIERVVEEARALRQGDPLAGNGADIDVGAMTMPHQVTPSSWPMTVCLDSARRYLARTRPVPVASLTATSPARRVSTTTASPTWCRACRSVACAALASVDSTVARACALAATPKLSSVTASRFTFRRRSIRSSRATTKWCAQR